MQGPSKKRPLSQPKVSSFQVLGLELSTIAAIHPALLSLLSTEVSCQVSALPLLHTVDSCLAHSQLLVVRALPA